ncbi:MAG: phosphoserine transaminase [Acidimicrobiia bacterium]
MSNAADPTAIKIPNDLLPGDGRFGSGPSKVRPEAAQAVADAATALLGTSHRQPAVRNLVGSIRSGLADLFELPDGYEVLLGNGGSTLFWDAAAFGLIERRSEHLVFGEFSGKFAEAVAAAPFLDDPVIIESEVGTHPDLVPDASVDAYAYPHNETVTGVMADVVRPDADGLVLVDGTSAAAGMAFDPKNVDVYYFAPQKAFASDGGLWFALMSPAAIERIERLAATDRWVPSSLSLSIALENSRLDQTYNTPAIGSLVLLDANVKWMLDHGGLAYTTGRCDRSAEILYGWAEASAYASPYVAKPSERSHTVATIDFAESVDGAAVAQALRANGVLDTEPYRKLGRNQLRIAMFPAIDPDDIAALTRCIDFVVDALA